ncbi:E3 ubiquitin-protein ligase ZFP91-like [Echeneis naucrates]|uniref:E3 ubiquitin-protein ligase ZFP91 n=1 Tax=Echeneis naucrates TaxID=173247 RepID=A0A665XDH3_ECHNA|nr:E3 ubiquitin-protein ligase ZFP91-like [Echeneis naucrates]
MDTEEDEVSGTGPAFETTGDPKEAPTSSTDSPETLSGRRGRARRLKTAANPADSCASGSGPGRSARVLRARAAKRKPESLLRGHGGRAARSRCKNSRVTQSVSKKSSTKKACKHVPGPKLSKSRQGKGRPSTRASHKSPATSCKPEAEIKASSCGEEIIALKGNSDNIAGPGQSINKDPPFTDVPDDLNHKPNIKMEKSKQCMTIEQKEVKKEESEEENDGNCMKKRGRQPRDDKAPRQPKRRKKPPVQYVRCEMEGCGTVLAHPRYLQHHIKYQHLLKKNYVCDHPSCGRLFRLQKQLLRHAKHHTDQRDYICEYCARAFKSSHNLAVHRMIHTGEKPIQCEICGFTCRQKASLNWHMKKHDAEASYQFSCSICAKKFEKKDSVVAHKAKSHPEVLIAEALAANEGTVISSPIPASKSEQCSVSQGSQEALDGTLTPLQQVVLPLAPQTQADVSQGKFLQLPKHQVVHVTHLTTACPVQLTSTSNPQLIQLPTIPASTVTPMTTADTQSTLLTLSSVTTLAPQQEMQWGRESDVAQIAGEGELWERVVVGRGHQEVGDIMWESNREQRKEDEGVVWEREGERQILLQCAEIHGDHLI